MVESIDEVLTNLGKRIDDLLKNRRLSPTARAQLEIQQLFLIYLQDTNRKVAIMWAVFRPMAWAMGIAAATIITLLVSGKVQIVIR